MPNQPYYNPRMTIHEDQMLQGPPPPPGMTAAQAYQAQVTQQLRPDPPESSSRGQYRLQVLDETFGEGRLDIAFPAKGSVRETLLEEPEPSPEDSELPWAATRACRSHMGSGPTPAPLPMCRRFLPRRNIAD